MDTFLTHFGHQLLRNVRNMSKICPKHVQLLNVSKYCPKGVHNHVKCPKSIQTFGHVLDNFITSVQRKLICPKSVQNMSKICPKYVHNASKMCPKMCPNFWTLFRQLRVVFKNVQSAQILDTFWTHVGHNLDLFWTHFGHIIWKNKSDL